MSMTVRWECGVCHEPHDSRENARACCGGPAENVGEPEVDR